MDKLLFVIGASSDMGCAAIKEVGGQYRTVVAHYLHMNEKLQDPRPYPSFPRAHLQ